MLPDPCKPSLSLQAKTKATWRPFTATKLFLSLLHSQPYFLFHFHTDPAVAGVFAVEVEPFPASAPCLKLALLLLLGSLLSLTSLLMLAFFLLLQGCHKLVSTCMAYSQLNAHQFYPTCKTATFLESFRYCGHLAPPSGSLSLYREVTPSGCQPGVVMATISKRRLNEASILASFSISKRNEPAYSRTCKD